MSVGIEQPWAGNTFCKLGTGKSDIAFPQNGRRAGEKNMFPAVLAEIPVDSNMNSESQILVPGLNKNTGSFINRNKFFYKTVIISMSILPQQGVCQITFQS